MKKKINISVIIPYFKKKNTLKKLLNQLSINLIKILK